MPGWSYKKDGRKEWLSGDMVFTSDNDAFMKECKLKVKLKRPVFRYVLTSRNDDLVANRK